MKRPQYWHELPYEIQEWILNRCEIDYDSYEGSRLDEINKQLNTIPPDMNHRNWQSAQSFYLALPDAELKVMCENARKHLQHKIDSIEAFLNQNK